MGLYRDEAGLVFEADPRFAESMGYSPVSTAEEQDIFAQRGIAQRGEERGIVGDINAAATGLASGLTLGLSDVALGQILTDNERDRLFSEIESHPTLRTGGEIVGAVAASVAAPGSTLARTPTGYLSAVASRQVEAGLARGGAAGVGRAVGAMGVEGAVQSAGQYVGHAALADTDVTAEGLAGSLGTGFAFGSVGGGAALGVTHGAMAGRKLFSRAMGTADVKAAESVWSRASQETLDADVSTAQTARARLDELLAAKAEALRYRNEARAAARSAPPASRAAPEAAAADEAFVGPEPLVDVGAQPRGMPTSVFKRPEAIDFDPGAARAFDDTLPELSVGPEPLIDVQRPTSGAQTSIFQRPAELAEAAEPTALEKALEATKTRVDAGESLNDIASAAKMPRTADDVVDETVTTVPARDIEAHGFESLSVPGKDAVKTEKGRKAIKEGQRDPITITVSPGGKYHIEDGTHRLAAAIESGSPVKVKWFRGSAGLDEAPPGNFVVAGSERVAPGAAVSPQIPPGKIPPASKGRNPSREIETMLAEKQAADAAASVPSMRERLANLGKGAEIPKADAGALRHQDALAEGLLRVENPPRPTFEFPKKAPFGRLRQQLTKELLGDAKLAELETELIDALDEFEAARKDFLDLATENFSFTMPGKRNVPSDFLEKDMGAKTASGTDIAKLRSEGKAQAAADSTAVGKRKMIEAVDNAAEEARLRAAQTADPREAGQALYDAEQLEKLLERLSSEPVTSGVPADFLNEVERGAKIIDRYEAAAARIAEVAGDGAHPISVERAKAFAQANDEAVRKATERATRAVEDNETFGPVFKTPKQRLIEADKAVADLKVDVEEAGQTLNKANAKVRAGEKAKKAALRADAKAARASARGAGAAEKLGALELLDLPGMPKLSDLPVVGPVLGAWLKYRTLKAALGRKMGKVPATADNRVAALAARTRDRIARAVDRSIGAMERGGKYAARVLPPAGGILANRIFDDGEDAPKKGAPVTELAAARIRELAAYVSTPGAIERDVRRELRDVVDPDIIAAAEKHRRAMMEYLLNNAPKGPDQGLVQTVKWQPSPAQAMSFARRVEAVSDPASVYERLAEQRAMLSLEAAEALRAVYPQLFAQAQQRMLERLAEAPRSIPYRQRVQMSLLYKLPFDAALDPDNLKITQSVYERKVTAPPGMPTTPPTPSVAGDTNLTALFQTTADRRAMR